MTALLLINIQHLELGLHSTKWSSYRY